MAIDAPDFPEVQTLVREPVMAYDQVRQLFLNQYCIIVDVAVAMQAGGIISRYPVDELTGLFVGKTVCMGIMTTPATEFTSEFRSMNTFKIFFLNGFEIE